MVFPETRRVQYTTHAYRVPLILETLAMHRDTWMELSALEPPTYRVRIASIAIVARIARIARIL